jgi:ficolin
MIDFTSVFAVLFLCFSLTTSSESSSCASETPRNCYHALQLGHKVSGIYLIDPQDGLGSFRVWCDMTTDGGGWTVFQRRRDGSVDFYRGWDEYRSGFGDLHGEFWLGLEKLQRLTTNQVLRFDLADFDNVRKYAQYDSFTVGPLSSSYVAYVGKYTGTAGDSFSSHSGMKFTTKDKDEDTWPNNCAVTYKGAWWYENCHRSNLNGLYLKGTHSSSADGVNWYAFKGHSYSLKFSEMKVRPQV